MPDGSKLSRRKALSAKKKEIEYPETCGLEFLLDFLYRMGLILNTGTTLTGISFTEINAWCFSTGLELSGWEIETIHSLSAAYAEQCVLAKDKSCPDPWVKQLSIAKKDNSKLADGILKSFQSFQQNTSRRRGFHGKPNSNAKHSGGLGSRKHR